MNKNNTHFSLFTPEILPLDQVIQNKNYEYPRFQRDFVWSTTKMRKLVESVYENIPINSIYLWKRTGVPVKNRSESDESNESNEKSLLVIDGQQRLTSLQAILLGYEFRKGSRKRKIQIAFNPVKGTFHEVTRKTEAKISYIGSIARFYANPDGERKAFLDRNRQRLTPENQEIAIANLKRLEQIKEYPFIIYNLSDEVDIKTAHKCFELTNQAGTKVNKGDLCMAWLETYQPLLAEGIVIFGKGIQGKPYEESRAFHRSKFSNALDWLKVDEPTNEPFQPKIGHIVELLFYITKGGDEFQLGSIAEELLKDEETPIGSKGATATTTNGNHVEKAFLSLVDATNYTRFNQIIRPFPGMNETDKKYAYWLFLLCVEEGKRNEEIARLIQRWYFLQLMSSIRLTGTAAFSKWMQGFKECDGLEGYLKSFEAEARPDLWHESLPDRLSDNLENGVRTKVLKAWTMVHVLSGDTALFDATARIETLTREKSEHHIYPQKVLQSQKVAQGKIDAIANIAITTTEINSAIGPKPLNLFVQIEQSQGRLRNLAPHFTVHCIPEETGEMEYDDFLAERAKMMAKRFKDAYVALKE